LYLKEQAYSPEDGSRSSYRSVVHSFWNTKLNDGTSREKKTLKLNEIPVHGTREEISPKCNSALKRVKKTRITVKRVSQPGKSLLTSV
jgi:hypothetical protein